jgi:diguanylate cyclase (GGDEF)-like protein
MGASTIWKAAAAALLALFAVGWSNCARAAGTDIPLTTCVAPVQPGDTSARLFASPDRYDCSPEQYRLGAGDFWVLSAPLPAADVPHYARVRFASLWQDALTLHARYRDGKVATIRVDSRALTHHLQLGAVPEARLPAHDARLERLLFRVDGAANVRGVLLRLHVVDAQRSATLGVRMAATYAAFGGLALALLVYNLALWGAMRHPFQPAYCAMVVALAAYAFSSSGALAWVATGIDNNDRLRINYVTLGLMTAAALLFARTFFWRQVFFGWLRTAVGIAIGLLASSGVVFAALSHIDVPLADRLYQWSFVAGLSTVVPILYRAWHVQGRFLWLFSLAWAAPVIFAVARMLAAMHLVGPSFWMDNSTVLSMAVEALVSSLAIAYRVQLLSRERDEARARALSLRMLADEDPLTGLLNRRAFLHAAVERAGTQTLHVVDVDHFKAVNDTLGHDGGDEVLRLIARTLRTIAGGKSLVARMGGEEFAILTDAAHPIDADRVLTALRQTRMPFDITITASIGSCTGQLATETDWKQLYRTADRALFEAKAAGRDRARTAQARALAA